MDDSRFTRTLEEALERNEVLLLSEFERSLNAPFKYEAKLNVLKLLCDNPDAFDYLVSRFPVARRRLNELIFDICRRNAGKLRGNCREYFTLHNQSNFNCCFKFSPSPKLLKLKSYHQIGLAGEYEYGMEDLRKGCLIMINNALVIEVSQPEKYTFCWQLRCPFCNRTTDHSQTFIEVVSGRSRSRDNLHYCEECKMDVDMIRHSERCFECQRITVLVEGVNECPPVFRRKHVYVDWNHVGQLTLGSYVDMVCYYELEPVMQANSKQGQPATIVLNEVFACESFEAATSQANWQLLLRDSFEMVKSKSPAIHGLSLESLYLDYQALMKAIKTFEFAACRGKLSALKLGVLASVLLNGSAAGWHEKFKEARSGKEVWTSNWNALNLFVVTEEVWLVRKTMVLPGLVYRFWPTLRSKDSMREFMLSCHDSIVLVSNPSAEDLPFLAEMLKGRIVYRNKEVPIRATIWVVMDEAKCEAQKTNRAVLELMDAFDLVLRVNFEKRLLNTDPELHQNILHFVDEYARKFVRGRPSPAIDSSLGSSCSQSQQDKREEQPASNFSDVFLKRYYAAARANGSISQKDLMMMQKVAEGLRLLRYHCIETPSRCRSLALIDVLFAVMFYEERYRNIFKGVAKFRSQLSINATRLLLNDTDRFQVKEIVDGDSLQAQFIERRRPYFFKMWVEELSRFVDLPVE